MEEHYFEIDGISKQFGSVRALRDVSFTVRKGEIHTILGENGAGKSTLVKIIRGELQPDAGCLRLAGRRIERYDPLYAHELGIAMVHQELAVFENMTVAENIFPSRDFTVRPGLVDRHRMLEEARTSLALFGLELDPGQRMGELSLAEQQIVEILRATSLEKQIIILDEPTSGLKAREAATLIARLKQLRDSGITILFISHRIPEILEVSDRVTILRDGQWMGTLENRELTEHELVTRMVGRELEGLYAHRETRIVAHDTPFLEVRRLARRQALKPASFCLYRGEILGVFGLEGSGVAALSRAVFGLDRVEAGELLFDGTPVRHWTPRSLLRRRLVYLNNNRKQAGLFLDMSACDNMSVLALERLSRCGLLKVKAARDYTADFVRRFNIVIPDVETPPRQLSGGNQQKLMLSICLGPDPVGMVVNEPTRGVDVGAKAEIHQVLIRLSEAGKSILVFSSELPELISLCDRVLVMRDRELLGEFSGEAITEETLMAAAVGKREAEAAING